MLYHFVWLDATLDAFQKRHLRQILLFLRNNSFAVYKLQTVITYNSHPWIMFSFNWLIIIWKREVRLKLGVQSQGGARIMDVDGQWGLGRGLENRTIFLNVVCLSFLNVFYRCPEKYISPEDPCQTSILERFSEDSYNEAFTGS